MGFSLQGEHGLESAGSVVWVHGLCHPVACGIFPNQGLTLCPLHWQVDSYPLYHQGSPRRCFLRPVMCRVLGEGALGRSVSLVVPSP